MPIVADMFRSVAADTETHWGQTIEEPGVYGVVEVASSKGVSAREIGIDVISKLTDLLQKKHHLLYQLKKSLPVILPPEIKSFILLVTEEQTVHVFLYGRGAVYMRRGKTFAVLRITPGISSGHVQQGDVILLLSAAATNLHGKMVSKILSPELTPQEVAEAMTVEFSRDGNTQAGEVGLVFHVRSADEPKAEIPSSLPLTVIQRRAPGRLRATIHKIPLIFKEVKKRPVMIVTILLGLFFITSVVLGIRHQATDRRYRELVSGYQEANRLFIEGLAVMNTDQAKSRLLLTQAKQRLQSVMSHPLPKGKEARDITDLSQKISDNLAIVSRIYKQELQLFYDANFLRKGSHVSAMTVKNDNLFFLDQDRGLVAVVALDNKNADVVGGDEEVKHALSLAASDTKVYLLTDQGVLAMVPKQTGSTTFIPKDSVASNPQVISTFGTNIYLLDKSAGKLWRYLAKADGLDKPKNFFADDVTPDLSQTTNVVIDGSVWLGSKIGKIFRYTQGRDDAFLTSGIDPPLGQILYLAKEEDGQMIYLLDSDKKRVVVVNPRGEYVAQYQWDQEIHPTDIAVSESRKRVYLLADQKIYLLSLQ